MEIVTVSVTKKIGVSYYFCIVLSSVCEFHNANYNTIGIDYKYCYVIANAKASHA